MLPPTYLNIRIINLRLERDLCAYNNMSQPMHNRHDSLLSCQIAHKKIIQEIVVDLNQEK
jgi:hypothetical protein